MSTSAYDDTSGSAVRERRPMMEPVLVFDLAAEVTGLREEPEWTDGDRNSRMLAKDVDLRVLLTALRDGASIDEQNGDARVSLQILEGTGVLELSGGSTELRTGQVAVVDAGNPWVFRATGDCAVLLTLAWPTEKAGV